MKKKYFSEEDTYIFSVQNIEKLSSNFQYIFVIYSTSSASCPLICASCNSFIRTLPYLVRSKPEPELLLFGPEVVGAPSPAATFSDNPEVAEVDVVSFPC